MKRIVICMNDYPHAVMEEGVTEEDAAVLCKQLSVEHNGSETRAFGTTKRWLSFHHHEVDVIRKERMK